jgi:GTP-binding protein
MQAQIAIEEADEIIFVLDYHDQIMPEDLNIAKILYQTKKPIILAVNKYDKKDVNFQPYEFMSLGFGEPIMISSTHGIGIGDLLDELIAKMPRINDEEDQKSTRVAIVGKPNVGKSSLVNSILGEQRMIVSDVAGTTRDAVDSKVKYHGQEYVLIDTAGLRRKGKIYQNVEKYSYLRSLAAINSADITILMLDISQKISDQDTNIGGLAFEEKKPVIIVANK